MPRPVIRQKLCPAGLLNHSEEGGNSIQYITVHMTDALVTGCGAAACAQYLFDGHTAAGWHYSVDALEIWQSFRDDQICRHAGGGWDSPGNAASLGVTVCAENKDVFAAACARAARLTACLMFKYGLPLHRVVPHTHWSSQDNCKTLLRGRWGVTWEGFLTLVNQIATEGYDENQLETKTEQP